MLISCDIIDNDMVICGIIATCNDMIIKYVTLLIMICE